MFLVAGVAAVLLLSLAQAGCGREEPLGAIRKQQAAGDFAGTVEPLRTMLLEHKHDPEINYLYGRALVYTGWPSLATWPLREAMEDPAWLAPAGIQLAQASLITDDFNEAVKATTRILEANPDDAQALLYRAQAQAHWKQDPEAALADADRALELDPDLIEAYEPRILALLELERHSEAAASLEEAGRRMREAGAPESALAWHCSTTAVFAAEAGDTERAEKTTEECLEKYPTDVTVVSNALKFYDSRGELDRSLEVARAAYDADRSQRNFRNVLAGRLRIAGKPEEGEALLREATEAKDPRTSAAAWADLAKYRQAMREHGAAADALARAVERAREVGEPDPRLLFQYADALVMSGQLDRALQVADEISVPVQSSLIRARVAQERGDPAKALQEYDEALRLWPDNPSARYYAARAAEQLGDFDRALEEYRYAVRIDPSATDARTRVAKLLIGQKEYRRAYQLLFLEANKHPLDPEARILGMYLIARIANPKQIQQALAELARTKPALVPLALARAAEGAAERAGPGAALNLLKAPGVDYTAPRSGPALRDLIRFAHAAGQPEVARSHIDAALAKHPDVALFHELRGLHLELAGAPADEIRAAYQKAVEIDPNDAAALLGLGGVSMKRDPAAALALFDRAAAAAPGDPAPALAAARALLASGRADEGERRLEALLRRFPLEGEAAAELAALDLQRGEVTQRTLEWARRAARFGGGPAAFDRLSQVYAQLDQPEEAEKAAQQAKQLRERRPPQGEEPQPAQG